MVSEREARTTEAADACRTTKSMQEGYDFSNRGWSRYPGGAEDRDQGVPRVPCGSDTRFGKRRSSGRQGCLYFRQRERRSCCRTRKTFSWIFLQNQIGFTIRKIADTTAIQDHILEETDEMIQFFYDNVSPSASSSKPLTFPESTTSKS